MQVHSEYIIMADKPEIVQVVTAVGEFNDTFEDYVKRSQVAECGTNYQVVAITGPQSSGKSTLMNSLVKVFFLALQAVG